MPFSSSDTWPEYTYIEPQSYTQAKVRLIGLGTYIPSGIITNDFFAYVATRMGSPRTATEIERVTGLQGRHVRSSTLELCRRLAGADAPGLIANSSSTEDESTVDMAVKAARRALASAGRSAEEIDVILAGSSSDNDAFPTLAGLVQLRLGCRRVRASTFKGACACDTEAFQAALDILAASQARLVLIVLSEALLANIAHILDWKTSSLFGEGAAAFLLERGETDEDETYAINGYDAGQAAALYHQTPLRKDVLAMAEVDKKILELYHAGLGEEANRLLTQYLVGYARMNGKEVYREAPRAMAEAADVLCRIAHVAPDDVAHIIPHQPNSRIILRLGELLIRDYGWPENTIEKLADHFRYYGNTSNASIGMAFVETLRLGRLQKGQWIILPAAGGGMHYGSWMLRYQGFAYEEAVLAP
ncbi:MAG TPA: 3-oxoacyl-[acyl-carrier-protein] synthase III C-terminal domain-containing protein, partial [Ktedonobacteraceae bacterium]|nr:3-oxoacyl-[acyl-carrier-protein] synthase III C-terminal domain-containing protein [Ktedonobacteraceae bacterium]